MTFIVYHLYFSSHALFWELERHISHCLYLSRVNMMVHLQYAFKTLTGKHYELMSNPTAQ